MTITMPRGDIKIIRFQVYEEQTGEITSTDFTEIFMTLKKALYYKDFVFQKKLSTGEIEKLGVGDYQIKIESRDTDSLEFNETYPFDIELIYGNEIKQTEMGELILTPEVTCKENEVSP